MAAQFENRTWGGLLLRGFVAILFGILALARPGATVTGLVYLFGAFALIDGIFAVSASLNVAEMKGRWWPLLLAGLAGIVIGVLTFINPAVTALGLVFYVGAWAIVTGVLEIAGAFRLRKVIEHEWMLGIAGLLSIVFGVIIWSQPGAGMLSLVWLIGIYAIVFGALEIGLSLRLRGAERHFVTP
jgi:uncharacterized membrane protein HdeD (DUF308 family)